MYLSADELEKEELRQGDIIQNIHCIGALNLKSIQYINDISSNLVGWNVPNKPEYLDVMVLSHSCEISKENGTKMTSIILAPIRDINTATQKEKIEELKNSNLITGTTTASYLKYFYIEPNTLLKCSNGAIVDFSKSFSVRKQVYDDLLKNKILQLKPEVSDSMSLKHSLYFYRKKE